MTPGLGLDGGMTPAGLAHGGLTPAALHHGSMTPGNHIIFYDVTASLLSSLSLLVRHVRDKNCSRFIKADKLTVVVISIV